MQDKIISIEPLLQAFEKFEQFRLNDKTEQERAGIIKSFEYCFELSWKVMKRLLSERGIVVNSPKETFRQAAAEGFINDLDLWFDFLEKRNLTSHVYSVEYADAVISVCLDFSSAMKQFLRDISELVID
jgi:nucleotidyltransferase substrate binding protein (TIGR01987 family)